MRTGTIVDNRENRIRRELSQKGHSKEKRKKLARELKKLRAEAYTL